MLALLVKLWNEHMMKDIGNDIGIFLGFDEDSKHSTIKLWNESYLRYWN